MFLSSSIVQAHLTYFEKYAIVVVMDLAKLGEVIKEYRIRQQLTQKELSKRLGITISYLSMLERGKNPKTGRPSQPSYNVLEGFIRELDIDRNVALDLAGYQHDLGFLLSPLSRKGIKAMKGEIRENRLLDRSQAVKVLLGVFQNKDMTPAQKNKIDKLVASFTKWLLQNDLSISD